LRDAGLLHQLLGITTERELLNHPRSSASWEGYAIEETLRTLQPNEAYFWATHQGAELDLLLLKNGRRIGVELKRMDAPTISPSMRIALEDLSLDLLHVIYPGERQYVLGDRISVTPFRTLADDKAAKLMLRPHARQAAVNMRHR
jgi:predicted AAA+ superfamily ATPase